MSTSLIQTALKSATDTKDIVFGHGVLDQMGPMFARLFPGKEVLVVADENTFAAAGEGVVQSLKDAGVPFAQEPYVFPGTPTLYAGYENVEILREYIRPLENAIVCSIASGTLNDIAKLASGELGRPYMNVCTAPSVDGYAAFGASISKDGFKITRNCPAPVGLVADTEVIAAAPRRLLFTGYGDLIEKIPAGADWIVADELGIEPIDPYVWSLVQGPLRASLDNPAAIGNGDEEAITGLAEGNIMSGLAMQAAQSSRPASGAGHQFSHTWEMEGHGLDWEPPLSHGMKEEAAERLDAVGGPSHPEQIGVDMDRFRETHFKAQMIRSRYTILDVLTDIGKLDDVVDKLFAPDGYWGKHFHADKEISNV